MSILCGTRPHSLEILLKIIILAPCCLIAPFPKIQNKKVNVAACKNYVMVQPMWDEEVDKSVELKNKVQRFPSFFPVRVSPKVLTNQESSKTSPNNDLRPLKKVIDINEHCRYNLCYH